MQDLVNYFIAHTDKRFDELKESIDKNREEIDDKLHIHLEEIEKIKRFKWLIWGGVSVVVFIANIAVAYFSNK